MIATAAVKETVAQVAVHAYFSFFCPSIYLVEFVEDNKMKVCTKGEIRYYKDKLETFWSPKFFPAILIAKSCEYEFDYLDYICKML